MQVLVLWQIVIVDRNLIMWIWLNVVGPWWMDEWYFFEKRRWFDYKMKEGRKKMMMDWFLFQTTYCTNTVFDGISANRPNNHTVESNMEMERCNVDNNWSVNKRWWRNWMRVWQSEHFLCPSKAYGMCERQAHTSEKGCRVGIKNEFSTQYDSKTRVIFTNGELTTYITMKCSLAYSI